jgi:hypothetical protein
MTFSLAAAAAFALTLFLIPGCDDTKADLEEVLAQYMSAMSKGDGEAALSFIDPKNIEHADAVLEAARTCKWNKIEIMTPKERIDIGVLRATMSAAELKALDGRKLFKLEAEKRIGLFDDEEVEFTLTGVKSRPPRATAELVINGLATSLRIEFVQVEGKWLLNDDCLDNWFNTRIHERAKAAHMDENSLVIAIVSRKAGREVHLSIYDEIPK